MSASRLKRSTLFCYSAGSLVETCLYGFCGLYLMNYYTDVVRLDPRLIGIAFSIRFVADALTDPLVGFFPTAVSHAWAAAARSCWPVSFLLP